MLEFYVSPTAKVIRRRNLGLKSHPKDWRSPGSNSRPLSVSCFSLFNDIYCCILGVYLTFETSKSIVKTIPPGLAMSTWYTSTPTQTSTDHNEPQDRQTGKRKECFCRRVVGINGKTSKNSMAKRHDVP